MEQTRTETLVIGAGMAGLSCAKLLADAGHQVLVVDKARGSGGRMASKRLTLGDGHQVVFDLGCSGVAAQTRTFLQQMQRWQEAGLLEQWRKVGGIVEYVGKPRNSMLTRFMADQLSTRFSVRIQKLIWQDERWLAFAEEDASLVPVIEAQHLVLATPAEQAAALLPEGHAFKSQVAAVTTLPQWVVVLVSPDLTLSAEQQAALLKSSLIRSAVCDSQKPGRTRLAGMKVWQVQLSSEWSEPHCDDKINEVYQAVLTELERVTGKSCEVSDYYVHRWLYASGHRNPIHNAECLWDVTTRLGLCGDYFHHPELAEDPVRRYGVESAFLSGRALAAGMRD